ncbi:MAG: hypothetical protein LAP39_00300 [Acidobacteriia bacterium]|jgi:hypothetical protein|nr:hypothetical protein [Terriglobia bacterium]
MFSLAGTATSRLQEFLTAPNGLNTTVAILAQAERLAVSPLLPRQLFTENVSSDIADRSIEQKYTAVYIYCDKLANALTEKFRSFSGTIDMTIDVRVSQDRLEGIDRASQVYAAAVTQTLNQNRGDWGQGLFFAGRYEVSFGPVKHGGRNFIKSAKISIQLDASVD